MSRNGILSGGLARLVMLLAVLALPACSLQRFQPQTTGDAQPEVIESIPIDSVSVTPLQRTPLPPQLPPVAIVLTNSQPAYADVARELTRHFKRYEVYDLSTSSQPPVSILRSINDSNSGAVIAIGLRAAQSSVSMSQKPVVFSQVFNYTEHDLLGRNSRGVSPLAPLDAQLAAWKRIDPTATRIGVIVGSGHEELIEQAKTAADRHDIELHVQETTSDQETLYVFRRMIHDIDGFWLFPDNRVLSPRALKEMLAEARRQQVPVNVPSETMLQLGAMISMSAVPSDIARTIVSIVRHIQAGELQHIPPITQLSEIRVVTNDTTQVVER